MTQVTAAAGLATMLAAVLTLAALGCAPRRRIVVDALPPPAVTPIPAASRPAEPPDAESTRPDPADFELTPVR